MLSLVLFRVISYAKYFWRSSNNNYIHSPFVYEWLSAVKTNIPSKEYKIISDYRQSLASDTIVKSFAGKKPVSVSQRYALTSIHRYYGQVLYQTANYLKAQNIVELGTSLGVSTLYLSLTRHLSALDTIDADDTALAIAKKGFEPLEISSKIDFHHGNFSDILPQILRKRETIDLVYIDGDHSYRATLENVDMMLSKLNTSAVIILDDIRWSSDMYRVWEYLCTYSQFNYTIDFGRIGLLFHIQNKSPKQHFILR